MDCSVGIDCFHFTLVTRDKHFQFRQKLFNSSLWGHELFNLNLNSNQPFHHPYSPSTQTLPKPSPTSAQTLSSLSSTRPSKLVLTDNQSCLAHHESYLDLYHIFMVLASSKFFIQGSAEVLSHLLSFSGGKTFLSLSKILLKLSNDPLMVASLMGCGVKDSQALPWKGQSSSEKPQTAFLVDRFIKSDTFWDAVKELRLQSSKLILKQTTELETENRMKISKRSSDLWVAFFHSKNDLFAKALEMLEILYAYLIIL